MHYLDQLNEIQRQAVMHMEGPALVVAGPGSGKTRVLTYRIAHLIDRGIPPYQIMALTFTNKAAREMKERIQSVTGPQAYNVWAGTFHSIFARILRYEAEHIGYPSSFTIYDTDDSKSLIKNILNDLHLSKDQYNPNSVRARISSAKTNLISPKRYEQDQELMAQDRAARRPHFAKIYQEYVARCKRSGAMDFDDLLYRLYELLQNHPDITDKYRKRFPFLLIDEFQDTNFLQYQIAKKLTHYPGSSRNILVVGDDAQSIYAFRGATIQNILDFQNDFKPYGVKTYKLVKNYRSTEHIVQAANQVITHNKRQIPKTIESVRGSGNKIHLIKAMTDNEEGKRVVDAILEQKNRLHLRNRDIAILYRTNAQSRIFEENLRQHNIPYRVFGGLSFYQRKEVKDLIAYFRLAINPKDDEALRRIINYPKRGIGKTTLEKISAQAALSHQTLWQTIPQMNFPSRTQNALDGFTALIKDFRQMAEEQDAYQTALHIARRSGILNELKKDTSIEGLSRMENINSLLDGIKEFTAQKTDDSEQSDLSLAAYIQNIALLTDLDQNLPEGDDFVTLMSIHAAKGLEFPSVFVVGLEEQLFPSFMAMESPEGLEEERRLFYVAITRAKNFLTLSYALSRYRYGQMRYNDPSRFLTEINPQHIEGEKTIAANLQAMNAPTRSGVKGNFKRAAGKLKKPVKVPKDFHPSPSAAIQSGMEVFHLQFGKGKVLAIDGSRDKRVATIFFHELKDQKRIMLKFAKLQILK